MKTQISITPNRERGYDAIVSSVRSIKSKLPAYLRNREGVSGIEYTPMAVFNAPSESAARALAQAWINDQPKVRRATRNLDPETQEAIHNERDYQ